MFTLNALNSINLSLVLITVNTCILNITNTWHQLLLMLFMLGLQIYVTVTLRFAFNKIESIRFPTVYVTLCDVVLTNFF